MTAENLQKDDRGRVLASLIEEYGSNAALGRATGFSAGAVAMWVQRGYVSKRAAIRLADKTGRMKEEFRPDLSDAEWDQEFPGPNPGIKPSTHTKDGVLLVRLAKQYGSVKALCDAAQCKVSDYHTWKSRGKISAIKLPTLLGLKK